MKMKIDANDALQIIAHMVADNLATNRIHGETIIMLLSPNSEQAAATIVETRQRIKAEMQIILNKIYENYGLVNINDILPDDSGK